MVQITLVVNSPAAKLGISGFGDVKSVIAHSSASQLPKNVITAVSSPVFLTIIGFGTTHKIHSATVGLGREK